MPRPPWNGRIVGTASYQHLTAEEWSNNAADTSPEVESAYSALKDGITWELVLNMLNAFRISAAHNRDIPYMYFWVRLPPLSPFPTQLTRPTARSIPQPQNLHFGRRNRKGQIPFRAYFACDCQLFHAFRPRKVLALLRRIRAAAPRSTAFRAAAATLSDLPEIFTLIGVEGSIDRTSCWRWRGSAPRPARPKQEHRAQALSIEYGAAKVWSKRYGKCSLMIQAPWLVKLQQDHTEHCRGCEHDYRQRKHHIRGRWGGKRTGAEDDGRRWQTMADDGRRWQTMIEGAGAEDDGRDVAEADSESSDHRISAKKGRQIAIRSGVQD